MLRAAEAEDLQYFYRLYMHPDINPFLLYDPMSLEDFTPIFQELLVKKVLYVFMADEQAAGMCKLIPQEYRNAHMAYLGGVAIDPALGGKGYGRMMLEEVLDWARQRQLRRVELSVAVSNERAIRLYEKVGFQQEGILRKYTWFRPENRFIDEIMMSWIN